MGLLYGMGLEGSFQTGGTVSDADFITAMVLILLAVFFARLGFAAHDREQQERRNQYCRDYRAHNEKPARVMWYTVWDAKTGDLLASGTSEMCARRLGYKSANSFASAVSHGLSGSHRTYKYTFARERIDRSEVDSLPPVRTIRKKPAGAPTPTSCKG